MLIISVKKNNLEKFFIKSSREADMIKELVSKASDNFPKSIIYFINLLVFNEYAVRKCNIV